eukprot:g1757.t1
MRRHQHKRGLGVGEDCRYAVFSDATMNVDTFHLPTPSERPSSRETPSSSDPTIDLARAVVKRCMQLVDVVAAEVAAGFDCLDYEWLPKRPKSSCDSLLSSHVSAAVAAKGHAKRAWRGLQELRIQTGDSHLILTSPEGDVLKEWAEALRKEAQDPPAEELFFAVHPCLLFCCYSGNLAVKDCEGCTMMHVSLFAIIWNLEPVRRACVPKGMYAEKIDTLIRAATELQKLQPIVSEVTAPVKVFGILAASVFLVVHWMVRDIHGQLRDLLLLFHFYGRPDDDEEDCINRRKESRDMSCPWTHDSPESVQEGDDEPMSYVFNGDWVDRGRHQLEVMLLILSLKKLGLQKQMWVWLNRGNHEDRQQNLRTTKIGSLGFDRACFEALGAEEGRRIFESFQSFFEWLPLAARIEQKVLVLHGGLGPGDWTLEDLSQVERPLVSKELHFTLEGVVYNILWSDPLTHKP